MRSTRLLAPGAAQLPSLDRAETATSFQAGLLALPAATRNMFHERL
jgi:hypothetical protein